MYIKIFAIYGVVLALIFIYWTISMKINKKKRQKYIEEFLIKYPDAVKVYIQTNTGFIVTANLIIYSVNNELPATFKDSEGNGFYCKVGTNVIEVEYSTTRPGIIYRTVTKSTGATKIEIETKPNEAYHFYYDKGTSSFKIDLK